MIPNKNQFYKIVAKHSGKVVSVHQNSTADNANITQYYWHGGDSQRWIFIQLNNNYYAIVAKHSGKVVSVYQNSTADNANVHQYYWHGGNSQQWFLQDQGDSFNSVINKNSGKVMSVHQNSTADNANITQYTWHGGDSQRWKPEAVESFTLPSVPTYPVPDVPQYEDINDILPELTEKVTTNYTLAPFIAVDDPYFGDNDTPQQIKTNLYYLYVRKQYWKRVASHTLAPNETHKYSQTTGMTQEDQNIVSKTVGHTIGVDVGFQFGKEDKRHSSAGLSYQYTTELATHESHTTTQMTEETKELTINNPYPYNVAWSKYVLVSEYSVQRSDGTFVNEPWTIIDPNTTRSSYYPPTANLMDIE
ncbi:RICIN domain-containing protein [Paenibacillus gorillae]|uniref:RICIN domain-containing protein n=1 Tax=Paenibacillus gorillae TaxID=1243662 RepID=UPI0004B10FCF|nr:RICIN domain-containing protein [Paenibacillus gorillae]